MDLHVESNKLLKSTLMTHFPLATRQTTEEEIVLQIFLRKGFPRKRKFVCILMAKPIVKLKVVCSE